MCDSDVPGHSQACRSPNARWPRSTHLAAHWPHREVHLPREPHDQVPGRPELDEVHLGLKSMPHATPEQRSDTVRVLTFPKEVAALEHRQFFGVRLELGHSEFEPERSPPLTLERHHKFAQVLRRCTFAQVLRKHKFAQVLRRCTFALRQSFQAPGIMLVVGG